MSRANYRHHFNNYWSLKNHIIQHTITNISHTKIFPKETIESMCYKNDTPITFFLLILNFKSKK